ncbi:MAG TPA: Fe-S cluster assembly ATPase SufC [Chitinophagaceae bacterium]|nr:Fe-S cluster assembly ATPase SufC [Chitinophagaceae bacterium]
MLSIKDLQASVEDKQILKGINLDIQPGEVHAIMGPNGSGKSTLASVLAGREEYEVNGGEVSFLEKDLLELEPEERARMGLFLAFQYPIEIPGVSTTNFLKTAVNETLQARGEKPLDAVAFMKLMRENLDLVQMDKSLLSRALNEGFSGGEKKRNEVFQMAMLDPKLAIMDETDSGLDIDALRLVADGVNKLRDGKRSFLVITHYQRLLNYIVPDKVHVMHQGRLIKSGDKSLALELEERGYDWLKKDVGLAEVK